MHQSLGTWMAQNYESTKLYRWRPTDGTDDNDGISALMLQLHLTLCT